MISPTLKLALDKERAKPEYKGCDDATAELLAAKAVLKTHPEAFDNFNDEDSMIKLMAEID